MAKARYKDEDVDLIREANSGDPGFVAGEPNQALIRNGKGEKSIVPLGDILLYAATVDKVVAALKGVDLGSRK